MKDFGSSASVRGITPGQARDFLLLMEADRIDMRLRGYVAILCWVIPGGMHMQAWNHGRGVVWGLEGFVWFLFSIPFFFAAPVMSYVYLLAGYWLYFLLRLKLDNMRLKKILDSRSGP